MDNSSKLWIPTGSQSFGVFHYSEVIHKLVRPGRSPSPGTIQAVGQWKAAPDGGPETENAPTDPRDTGFAVTRTTPCRPLLTAQIRTEGTAPMAGHLG